MPVICSLSKQSLALWHVRAELNSGNTKGGDVFPALRGLKFTGSQILSIKMNNLNA